MSAATATQRRGIRLKPVPDTDIDDDPAAAAMGWTEGDALSLTCPKCGADAEYPDCESCGHLFGSEAEGQSEPPAEAPKPYARRIAEAHEIPAALREMPYWVAWRLVQKPGKAKPDKVPVSPKTGKSNWSIGAEFCTDFETARDYAERNGLQGVGFLLVEGCGVSGIDLDHCRDPQTGDLSDSAQSVIETADTYFEVSPGLSGVRGFFLGGFNGHIGNNHEAGVEFYEDDGKRFLTVTGDHLEETPFAIETRDLAELGARYFKKQADKASTNPPGEADLPPFESVDLNGSSLSPFTKHLIRTGDTSKYNGDRSAALFGAAKDLLKAGYDDETATRILCDPDNGISEKALSERGGDLASAMEWTLKYTIPKARAAVEQERKVGADAAAAFTQGNASQTDANGEEQPSQQQKAPSFRLAPISELLEQPEPLQWLIPDYLTPAMLALIFGEPASGKSLLVIDWCACLATARDWCGRSVKHGPVVYIAGEGHQGIRRRFLAWAKHHDCVDELRDSPLFVSETGAGLISAESLSAVVEAIDAIAHNHDVPALIVIDTLHRNLGPGDENSAEDIARYIAAADAIKARYGSTVLTVHHSGHGDKGRSRGSSAIRAAVDVELQLAVEPDSTRVLSATKMKDAATPAPIHFALQEIELPWLDAEGNNETSVVLAEQEASETTRGRKKAPAAVRLAFETLIAALDESGDRPPRGWDYSGETPAQVVTLDDWRGQFYARHTGDNQESKKKAFQRARTALVAGHGAGHWDDLYWPTAASNRGCDWADLAAIENASRIVGSHTDSNRDTGTYRDIGGTCPGASRDGTGHHPIGVSRLSRLSEAGLNETLQILKSAFGTRSTIPHPLLVDRITEQTGDTQADAQRFITAAVTNDQLLRDRDSYRLPAQSEVAA